MTLRMQPWEAERVANVLEDMARLRFSMKPWATDCAARIKEAVKAEMENDKRRRTEDRG